MINTVGTVQRFEPFREIDRPDPGVIYASLVWKTKNLLIKILKPLEKFLQSDTK